MEDTYYKSSTRVACLTKLEDKYYLIIINEHRLVNLTRIQDPSKSPYLSNFQKGKRSHFDTALSFAVNTPNKAKAFRILNS